MSSQSNEPVKICPACHSAANLSSLQCGKCGHIYRTQFSPASSTTDTGNSQPWATISPTNGPTQNPNRVGRTGGGTMGIGAGLIFVGLVLHAYVDQSVIQSHTFLGQVAVGLSSQANARAQAAEGVSVISIITMGIGGLVLLFGAISWFS